MNHIRRKLNISLCESVLVVHMVVSPELFRVVLKELVVTMLVSFAVIN